MMDEQSGQSEGLQDLDVGQDQADQVAGGGIGGPDQQGQQQGQQGQQGQQ